LARRLGVVGVREWERKRGERWRRERERERDKRLHSPSALHTAIPKAIRGGGVKAIPKAILRGGGSKRQGPIHYPPEVNYLPMFQE